MRMNCERKRRNLVLTIELGVLLCCVGNSMTFELLLEQTDSLTSNEAFGVSLQECFFASDA